jgi:D-glycero-D-manno-heptose 1,7-bisphosphate phosphatase
MGEREVKLAILDRDGTLIDVYRDEETGTIATAFHPNQIRLLDGVISGLKSLQSAGFVLTIATNQPGPAKGQMSAAAVMRTNDALVAMLRDEGIRIARVEVCMHHPSVGPCSCRKPAPGMLDVLVNALGANRSKSWMIGDARADVDAGRAAQVRTALVFRSDRCELCPLRGGPPGTPDVTGNTFDAVAAAVIATVVTQTA